MPSEQPPPHNPSSTRQGPPETLQHPPSRGGVRMLLGLPFSDSGALSTVALTAPSGRHRYGQSPLPVARRVTRVSGKRRPTKELSKRRGAPWLIFLSAWRAASHTRPIPRGTSLVRRCATALRFHEQCGKMRRMRAQRSRQPSAEHREQTRLVIPGVSTHRTAFPALSQTADTPTISVERRTAGRNPATGRATQRSGLPSSRARDDNVRRRVADQTRTTRHRRRESAEGFGGAVQVVSAALA